MTTATIGLTASQWSHVRHALEVEQERIRAILLCQRRARARQIAAYERGGRGTSFNDHTTPGSVAHIEAVEKERARRNRRNA